MSVPPSIVQDPRMSLRERVEGKKDLCMWVAGGLGLGWVVAPIGWGKSRLLLLLLLL